MKIVQYVVIVLMLSLWFSACEAFGSETLYRDPQPTEQDLDSLEGEAQPTPVDSLESAQIAADQSPVPEAFSLVVPRPEHGNLPLVLAAHAQLAADMGRRPFVEFSAEWCPPCQAIEASLDDPLMVEALRGIYLIRLDVDEWGNQISSSGFHVPGIPLFFELDSKGQPTGRAIAGSAWGEDVPKNMAPPLEAFFQGT